MMWPYGDLAKEMQAGYLGEINVSTEELPPGRLAGKMHRVTITARGFLYEGKGSSEAVYMVRGSYLVFLVRQSKQSR